MDRVTAHETELLHAARALVPCAPPKPWSRSAFIIAGGVVAAGWTEDENVILVSHDGYSVCAPDGQRLARDREYAGLSSDRLSFVVPGHSQAVRVFGVYGGDGAWCTSDGWSVSVIYPLWPRPWLVLRRPAEPGAKGFLHGATRLDLGGLDEHDWLRVGFSPSGRHLAVASASGCLVVSRELDG